MAARIPRGQIEQRWFECRYHPASLSGVPIPNETGNLPSIQIAARTQAEAEKRAHAQVGHAIVETIRLDDLKPPKPPRKPRQRKSVLASLGLVTAASLLERNSK